ncbi:TetR/AcrR family transcriptional regulator [Gryllotalpicola reticulitermitis]|uniref:TetR/AcrR family transcriptional regulator n=1 Tax=Gryllotalpicola reticulitermitis TaxID=1184153 RepID=A0ABV8QAF7_9MICO
METESARARAMNDTRNRILDVSLEVLGENSDASMGEIAVAAGVVRRTVYGHFPTRTELVHTLTQRAVSEIVAILDEVNAPGRAAERVWVDFIARLWPLMHRYRVLVALRRGEYGDEIHALLGPVDTTLAELVQRGQDSGEFGGHLRADILSQIAYAAVFSIADSNRSDPTLDARAATIASLLVLGVPEPHARALVAGEA